MHRSTEKTSSLSWGARTAKAAKAALALAMLAGLAGTAQAQLLKDPQWQVWADEGKVDELDRAARARLQVRPDDAEGAIAQALVALADGDPQRIDEASLNVQRCIEQQPRQAGCYFAMATIQGVEIMGGNVLKALSLAGKVKSNLQRALELDPQLFEARLALSQFYLKVPGIAGGSASKARELAQAIESSQPEHAKLLRAKLAFHDKQLAETERGLQAVKPGSDLSLQSALRDAWYDLGMQLAFDKQYAHANAVFENLRRSYPRQAIGPFGLGRVAALQGQFEEAINQFERARPLAGSDKVPLDYRLGIALMDKGDTVQARVVLERFVERRKGTPANREDARKRLAQMG